MVTHKIVFGFILGIILFFSPFSAAELSFRYPSPKMVSAQTATDEAETDNSSATETATDEGEPEPERVGVGVGTGKIIVDELLQPGKRYVLPALSVINTGNVTSKYSTSIQYHQDQPQEMPLEEWFTFSPDEYHLEPGQTQVVEISIVLPLMAEQGEYFAYLEAYPLKVSENKGKASIGVAAATRMYFTVKSSNIFLSIFHRIVSMYQLYQIPVNVGLTAVVVYISIKLARKYLKISLNIERNSK